jgi:hypothetical protein
MDMLRGIGLYLCGMLGTGLLIMGNNLGIVFLIPIIAYVVREGLRD